MMKELLYNIVFPPILVSLFFLIGESILTLVYNLTHNSKFDTLVSKDLAYPKNPDAYLKIAVFGGSSAAGFGSERVFSDILKYELKNRYPENRFYVKNYAQWGDPFHRHQAELLKSVIDKYDIFLIYTGNNEALNYLDDIGYFRPAEYKHQKSRNPFHIHNKGIFDILVEFLSYNSRIYAVTRKAYSKYILPFFVKRRKMLKNWQPRKFKEFESCKVLPPEEFEKMNTNFEKDLKEIAVLAKKKEKYVIISSVPTNGSYKPFFSVLRADLTEKEIFFNNYGLGLESYNKGEFNQAISYFVQASRINQRIAILNYLLGQSYLNIGNVEEGRRFIQASIDDDGMPFRSLSSLRKLAATISQQYDNFYYIDTVETFHKLLDNGMGYRELFSDFHHPSFMGHVVIAYNFLYKISELKALKGHVGKELCADFGPKEVRALVSSLKHKLGVSKQQESWTAFMISKWSIGMARLSAYPEQYLTIAEEKIMQYYRKSDQTSTNHGRMLLFMALIEAKKGNPLYAMPFIRQALELVPAYVRNSLYCRLSTGERVLDIFNEAGISLPKDKSMSVNNREPEIYPLY